MSLTIKRRLTEHRRPSFLMVLLGLKSKETLRRNYLNPAIEEGLVRMTLPDKPKSKNQRYVKQYLFDDTGVKVGAQLHFCDTELHFNKTDVKTKNISLC